MSVRMEHDWVEASPAADPLAQSTMAALSIEVDGCPVTTVLDRRSRCCRNHVVIPLAYVAEWLVGNWWRLFHEVEDERTSRTDFAETHDLAFAGEGFLLPSLRIAPTPQRMRLEWAPYRPSHSEIEFTERGEADVERQELQDTFRGIVEVVRERLIGDGLASELLQRDWAAIQGADADERDFCRAAALLGQDPFAVAPPLADQIVEFWHRAEPSVREDALATANGNGLASLAGWLTDASRLLAATDGGSSWTDMRLALPKLTAPRPYQRGYELARAVRAQLELRHDRYEFRETGPEALPSVEATPPSGSSIQGLVAANGPACANAARGSAKRFLLARALGDFLGRAEHGTAVLSVLATDRQAQSRAFAAEFLAPAASLRRRLAHTRVHPEELDDVAAAFGVSSYVVNHQIRNHRLAEVAEW